MNQLSVEVLSYIIGFCENKLLIREVCVLWKDIVHQYHDYGYESCNYKFYYHVCELHETVRELAAIKRIVAGIIPNYTNILDMRELTTKKLEILRRSIDRRYRSRISATISGFNAAHQQLLPHFDAFPTPAFQDVRFVYNGRIIQLYLSNKRIILVLNTDVNMCSDFTKWLHKILQFEASDNQMYMDAFCELAVLTSNYHKDRIN